MNCRNCQYVKDHVGNWATYAGEHVPGVQEDKRSDEPHHVGRAQRHDQGEELSVAEQIAKRETIFLHLSLDRLDRHEYRRKDEIYHDNHPEVHHGHVKLVRSLRSIAQR